MLNQTFVLVFGRLLNLTKSDVLLINILRHYRSPLVQDQAYNTDEDYFQKHIVSTSASIPIIIYFHGNAFDR
jgi:hypothetical protein